MANLNGVTYWKLNPETSGYDGDIQLPEGLCGTDLDGNFHFLRGMDFSSIEYDGNKIKLNRINGKYLEFSPEIKGKYEMQLSGGVLSITNTEDPEDKISVSGISSGDFLSSVATDNQTIFGDGTEGNPLRARKLNVELYTDFTLDGTGAESSPLSIGTNYKTGFYRPVLSAVTIDGLSAFTTNGDRVLLTEQKSDYGLLYDGVNRDRINAILEESGWRVPTEEDFADLEDVVVRTSTLKEPTAWPNGGSNEFGFDLLPTEKENGELVGTTLWMGGSNIDRRGVVIADDNDLFGETFMGTNQKASIRLVKTINPYIPATETEEINGEQFQIVPIGELYWTKTNIGFYGNGIDGSQVDGATYKTHYYVAELVNGRWIKKEMYDGESVVIVKNGEANYHIWRVENGSLIDTYTQINGGEYVTVSGSDIDKTITLTTEPIDSPNSGLTVNVDVKAYVDAADTDIMHKVSEVSSATISNVVSAEDDSMVVRKTATGTTISVRLSDDPGNILQLDTNDGLFVDANALVMYNAGMGLEITTADTINLVLDGATLSKSSNGLRANLSLQQVPPETIQDSEIRCAWKLVDGNGVQYGDTINVYKDSRFIDAVLGHVGGSVTGSATAEGYPYTDGSSPIRALQFIFTTKNGAYAMKEISLDGFFTVDNIGNGLKVRHSQNSAVTFFDVAIDPFTEPFISVSSDGVKIDGVQSAITSSIETEISKLDVSDSAVTNQVVTSVSETDGKINVQRGYVQISCGEY